MLTQVIGRNVFAAFEFEVEEQEREFENGGYDMADDAVEL